LQRQRVKVTPDRVRAGEASPAFLTHGVRSTAFARIYLNVLVKSIDEAIKSIDEAIKSIDEAIKSIAERN
jgi:hypothetical protein